MTKPKEILDRHLKAFFLMYDIKIADKAITYLIAAMHEYAEEYHRAELLKLNKSDVISSVCEHEKIYYCLRTGGNRCRKCKRCL
jgi:hypothetical protein